MKVLSTVRNIGVIFIGVALYGEIVTTNQALGYTIALIGFIGYNAGQMGYWVELPFELSCSFLEGGPLSASSSSAGLLQVSLNKASDADSDDENDKSKLLNSGEKA